MIYMFNNVFILHVRTHGARREEVQERPQPSHLLGDKIPPNVAAGVVSERRSSSVGALIATDD